MIARRNILDLIGKYRGKYHSCILTCYSLDFSFFEERVLPVLRAANIKNVNVLADGKFLEFAQANTTGQEFKHNKTYNFQPVYATGVFHPKIMLLTGQKHGLLLIGSGNITSSGLSLNDEIWGAFHLDNLNNENAGLFSEVWNYLQQFLNKSFGFIPQKIEWIKTHSPWVEELPKSVSEIKLESLGQTVLFVSNNAGESILQQLFARVPKNNLETITVISPYFDKDGEIIQELYNHYKPLNFNCILDTEYGLIPEKLENALSNRIKFYDWKDCKDDHIPHINRLHAKIIHFQFKDGTEFMLLGSANATNAGMGTSNKKAVNHEAGIIINRKSDISWIKELKIKLPKQAVLLKSIENKSPFNSSLPKTKYTIKLVYSELRGTELSVYTNEPPEEIAGRIQIFSRLLLETEKVLFTAVGNKLTAKCNYPEEIFKVCVISDDDVIVSNYNIVHRFESLLKCNPDPDREKLDSYLGQEYPEGEGVTELLTFIDYNWADEDTSPENKIAAQYVARDKGLIAPTLYSHDKLSAKEFNTISEEVLLKQAGELSNSNIKIAEFLNLISSGSAQTADEEFKESEEQKLLEDKDQKGEGEQVAKSNKIKSIGRKEKDAISKYFKKLNLEYYGRLLPFYDARAINTTPTQVITIRVLSNILIALQLIQMYYGKKYSIEVEKESSGEKELFEESYLHEGNLDSDCDTVKCFMIDVFGKFLLLSTAGMKKYDYEILNQKLSYNRKQIFQKALFITLNMRWRPSEIEYRDTILLNTLYFINPDSVNDETFIKEVKKQTEQLRLKAKYLSHSFTDNLNYFTESLLPKYNIWLRKFNDKIQKENVTIETTSLNKGSIIFNSKIGFNVVHKKGHNSHFPVLDLLRAGYEWNENDGACLWENITYGKRSIVYSVAEN